MNLFIFIGFLIPVLILFFLFKFLGTYLKADWKKIINKRLYDLNRLVESNDTIKLRLALIEADKLLDHALKMSGYKGATMGERLKHSKKTYKWEIYDATWKAHKARNEIVHEVGDKFSNAKLIKHFHSLKRAIQKLL